jgi:hypothetical protein
MVDIEKKGDVIMRAQLFCEIQGSWYFHSDMMAILSRDEL